ncbi:helical backbone metal receptor [Gilvibacter sp.]|uniref:helical backbone metal receptor n=1 Tax=Gilvibacter sp. TaxID=2729997 RepID=UPI003B525F77
MESKDQLRRIHHFDKIPSRIVSLVPSQTELLVDLGLRERLVGITKFCVHPQELRKQKVVVGGTKQVKFEKIASLQPDIIIANKEENTLEMVTELQRIAPVWVSDIYTVGDSLDFILAMGALFRRDELAADLKKAIATARTDFKKHIQGKAVIKTAYLIWKLPYMAAGHNTFIGDLLRENVFENIITDPKGRYPEVDLKTLQQADQILLSSEPYPFKEKDRAELEAQLGVTVKLVDGEYFSWYGSRLRQAYEYFKRLH